MIDLSSCQTTVGSGSYSRSFIRAPGLLPGRRTSTLGSAAENSGPRLRLKVLGAPVVRLAWGYVTLHLDRFRDLPDPFHKLAAKSFVRGWSKAQLVNSMAYSLGIASLGLYRGGPRIVSPFCTLIS